MLNNNVTRKLPKPNHFFEDAQCDLCGKKATKDAQIAGVLTWAFVCDRCFSFYCSGIPGTFTTLKNIGKPGRNPYSD